MERELREGIVSKLIVPDGKPDLLVHDTKLTGFGLRLFASGQAHYFCRYQIGNKQVRTKLGPVVPGVLAEMRKRAAIMLSDAHAGVDVVANRKVARKAADNKPETVGELIEKYLLARKPKLRPRYYVEISRQLHKDWKPLHGMALADVTRKHVVRVIDDIASGQGDTAADRARSALSAFYIWCVDRGHIDTTPVLRIKPRAEGGGRDRILSVPELVAVWNACSGKDDGSRIVRLLILSGQRRTEIGDLQWPEINFTEKRIELPAERTKNKRPSLVFLSDEALACLPERRNSTQFVFGRQGGGFFGWAQAKIDLDKRIAAALGEPLAHWTLHDLRRTFVTMINEAGIAPPHIVEALTNHISGHKAGVAGTYNRALYSSEKKATMDAWAKHVRAMVS